MMTDDNKDDEMDDHANDKVEGAAATPHCEANPELKVFLQLNGNQCGLG